MGHGVQGVDILRQDPPGSPGQRDQFGLPTGRRQRASGLVGQASRLVPVCFWHYCSEPLRRASSSLTRCVAPCMEALSSAMPAPAANPAAKPAT